MLLLLAVAACGRADAPPRVDSTFPDSVVTPPPPPVAATSTWNAEAGRYLLVPGATPGEALVIDPESQDSVAAPRPIDVGALAGDTVALFAIGGSRAAALVAGSAAPSTREECPPPWPAVRLDAAPEAWSVGLVGATAEPIAMESVAGLARPDSSALVAAAARVASALPVAEEAYFRGLPFAVHSLHRFAPTPGVQAFAAALVRRVSQEDSPLEERTFVIAERDSVQGRWHGVYHERTTGTEDDVESAESIAVLALGSSRRPSLLLVREVADGISYRLVERSSSGRWRVRWSSAVGKCG